MKIEISKITVLTTILVVCVLILSGYLVPRMTTDQRQLTGVTIIVAGIASIIIYDGVKTHSARKRDKDK